MLLIVVLLVLCWLFIIDYVVCLFVYRLVQRTRSETVTVTRKRKTPEGNQASPKAPPPALALAWAATPTKPKPSPPRRDGGERSSRYYCRSYCANENATHREILFCVTHPLCHFHELMTGNISHKKFICGMNWRVLALRTVFVSLVSGE